MCELEDLVVLSTLRSCELWGNDKNWLEKDEIMATLLKINDSEKLVEKYDGKCSELNVVV